MFISYRNKWIYYITQFNHSLVFTIPIWIVYYQARITVAQISFLVTFQYIMQMVLELPSGALADMVGRKTTVTFAFFIGAISFLLFPFAHVFWHFAVLALLIGVSDSFRSGSEEALLYDSFKQENKEREYKKVFANGEVIYQTGLISATALGGLLYSIVPFLPYVLYGFSLLFGTLATLYYKEPFVDSEKFTLRNYIVQVKTGTREAFKDEYTKYLSLFYILVGGIAWSSTLYFNEYMLVDLGFGNALRGYLSAGMRFLNVVIIASFLKSEKIFNWQRTVLFFPAIMLFGYLPGVFLHGFVGLPFVQAAMIATTARWTILSPVINGAFSSKYRATAISVLSLFIGFVYVGLTSVSGFVISGYGIKTMYTLLGIVTLFTVVPITSKLIHLKAETSS